MLDETTLKFIQNYYSYVIAQSPQMKQLIDEYRQFQQVMKEYSLTDVTELSSKLQQLKEYKTGQNDGPKYYDGNYGSTGQIDEDTEQ